MSCLVLMQLGGCGKCREPISLLKQLALFPRESCAHHASPEVFLLQFSAFHRGLAAKVCSLRNASEVYPLLGIIAEACTLHDMVLFSHIKPSDFYRGLAAEVCSLRDASEVYPLLGIIANVGLILGGGWIKTVNSTLAGEFCACVDENYSRPSCVRGSAQPLS